MSGMLSTLIVIGALFVAWQTATGKMPEVENAIKDILGQLGLGGLGQRAPAPAPSGGSAPSTGGSTPTGGNAGASKGAWMFSGTGKTWTAKDSGKKTRNYASGKPSTGTTQWDISGVGNVVNIETDLWVNVGSCGDSVSTKVFGGSHSDGNCCWLILNVDCASGTFELGGEGPHPTTESSNLGKGSSMGSIKNKEVGIKLVVTKSGSTFTATGYGNTGSGWKSYITKTFTQFGAKKKASSPASGATVQFRTDCSNVKYSVARAQEIAGGATASYANAYVTFEGDRYSIHKPTAYFTQPETPLQSLIKAILNPPNIGYQAPVIV